MSDHPTIQVTEPGSGFTAQIDAEIAPLVEAMWKLGIFTEQCCQSMEGWTWMVLGSVADLATLLVALDGAIPLDRLTDEEIAAPYLSLHRDRWRYSLAPVLDDGTCEFVVTVEFPPSDIPAVTGAIQVYAAK